MKRYIEQLIEDIHKATWNLKPPHKLWEDSEADPDDELELEDMSYVEQYIEGEKQAIGKITGIEPELLPPAVKLTKEQQALLATELEKLLQNFHFALEFSEKYPAHLRYSFIRKFWEEKHVPLSFGTTHIEFCDYLVENCPFPGYCTTCKEIDDQMKFDEEHGVKTDLDFDLEDILPSPEDLEDFFRRKKDSPDPGGGDFLPDNGP